MRLLYEIWSKVTGHNPFTLIGRTQRSACPQFHVIRHITSVALAAEFPMTDEIFVKIGLQRTTQATATTRTCLGSSMLSVIDDEFRNVNCNLN